MSSTQSKPSIASPSPVIECKQPIDYIVIACHLHTWSNPRHRLLSTQSKPSIASPSSVSNPSIALSSPVIDIEQPIDCIAIACCRSRAIHPLNRHHVLSTQSKPSIASPSPVIECKQPIDYIVIACHLLGATHLLRRHRLLSK